MVVIKVEIDVIEYIQWGQVWFNFDTLSVFRIWIDI